MKKTGILMLASLLVACTATPTMEQLEYQAMLSGDWSEVEKRERIIERRANRRGPQCPAGYIAYCERDFGQQNCVCAEKGAITSLLRGRY
ncbi:MAG: hypothetical protein QNJ07_03490 [Woeseiaceae bacterium]|nr:hypothetical protein [Woeseiaceae bacterium]